MVTILENAQAEKTKTSMMLGLAESLKILEQSSNLDEAKQQIKKMLRDLEHH